MRNSLKHLGLNMVGVVARGTAKAESRDYEMPPLTFRGRAFSAPSSTPEGRWWHFCFDTMSDSSSEEVWKPVPGYEGKYEVSSRGRVKSLSREVNCGYGATRTTNEKLLSPIVANHGYKVVHLRKNGRSRKWQVHHLVARAFVGAPPGKVGRGTDDYQVNHINGDRLDNRPENLEWVTSAENAEHADREGLVASGGDLPQTKLDKEAVGWARRIRRHTSATYDEISNLFGVGRMTIQRAIKGETWKRLKEPPPVVSEPEDISGSNLTPSIVREARRRYRETDVSFASLGREYGVCMETIRGAIRGNTWRHIEEPPPVERE